MSSKDDTNSTMIKTTAAGPKPQPRRQRLHSITLTACAVLLFISIITRESRYSPAWPLSRPISQAVSREDEPAFSWTNIIPQKQLIYHDCYEYFQCARLELPLDYNSTKLDGPTVAIALVRLPAKVPVTDPHYGGPILINPGGPGGSGVERVISAGHSLQNIVDAEKSPEQALPDDKYFDIVGFDPRGVNHSTPTVSCFPDNVSRQAWNVQVESEGLLGSLEANAHTLYRRARAFAAGCSNTLNSLPGYEGFGNHINTAPVVADMVEIVERHGQWRESTASSQSTEARERLMYLPGEEPVLFWGFSYGSLLGATFAAMQPHRVSKMVLDGVVSSDAYYRGQLFENLNDSDAILEQFFALCSEAGPDKCAFWRPGGDAAVQKAYYQLLTTIREDPMAVPGDAVRGPMLITYSNIKQMVRNAVYQPHSFFPTLATVLEDVATGNGTVFSDYKRGMRKPSCRSLECDKAGPYSSDCIIPGWDSQGASPAVFCSESPGTRNLSEADFIDLSTALRNQSVSIGDYWAQYLLGCAGWTARGNWLFEGPIAGQTAHPIMWIGNTYDPVTPLRNARKMAEGFPGSVVLQQNSIGHCSFSSPSSCTALSVRRYFQTGLLPEEGSVCETDEGPFQGVGYKTSDDRMDSSSLLNDVKEVVEAFATSYLSARGY